VLGGSSGSITATYISVKVVVTGLVHGPTSMMDDLSGSGTEESRRAEHELVHDSSTCVMCRNRREFVVPDHLLKQLTKRDVVIFAGAGVSTETSTVFPWTFY